MAGYGWLLVVSTLSSNIGRQRLCDWAGQYHVNVYVDYASHE